MPYLSVHIPEESYFQALRLIADLIEEAPGAAPSGGLDRPREGAYEGGRDIGGILEDALRPWSIDSTESEGFADLIALCEAITDKGRDVLRTVIGSPGPVTAAKIAARTPSVATTSAVAGVIGQIGKLAMGEYGRINPLQYDRDEATYRLVDGLRLHLRLAMNASLGEDPTIKFRDVDGSVREWQPGQRVAYLDIADFRLPITDEERQRLLMPYFHDSDKLTQEELATMGRMGRSRDMYPGLPFGVEGYVKAVGSRDDAGVTLSEAGGADGGLELGTEYEWDPETNTYATDNVVIHRFAVTPDPTGTFLSIDPRQTHSTDLDPARFTLLAAEQAGAA